MVQQGGGEVTGEHDGTVWGAGGTRRSCAWVADTWHALEPGQVEEGDRMDVTSVWHADIREGFGSSVVEGREGRAGLLLRAL